MGEVLLLESIQSFLSPWVLLLELCSPHVDAMFNAPFRQSAEKLVQCKCHFNSFQLEGTFRDQPVQLPDQFRAEQKSKHGTEGTVQTPLGQAQGAQHLARKPVAVSGHPQGKERLPDTQPGPPLVQLCAVPVCSQGAEISNSVFTTPITLHNDNPVMNA